MSEELVVENPTVITDPFDGVAEPIEQKVVEQIIEKKEEPIVEKTEDKIIEPLVEKRKKH